MRLILLVLTLVFLTHSLVKADKFENLVHSGVRRGVTSLQFSANGCASVQIGNRPVWLIPGFETNDLVLFENGAHNHAQMSVNFDPIHSTDIISLGYLDLEMSIVFDPSGDSLAASSGCNGILPLGPASGLWGYFSCVSILGNYVFLGMDPPLSAIVVDTFTVGPHTDPTILKVRVDLTEGHIQVPLLGSFAVSDLRIRAPFKLILPDWTYELGEIVNSDTIILGRTFPYVGSISICQAALVVASYNSTITTIDEQNQITHVIANIQDMPQGSSAVFGDFENPLSGEAMAALVRSIDETDPGAGDGGNNTEALGAGGVENLRTVYILPLKCRAEADGLRAYMKIMAFVVLVLMVVWTVHRAEKWMAAQYSYKVPQKMRGSLEFYASPFIMGASIHDLVPSFKTRLTKTFSTLATFPVRADMNDGELQLMWLFMMNLVVWNALSTMLVHGRIFCFLCPLVQACPLNPFLPVTFQDISQFVLVLLSVVLVLYNLLVLVFIRLQPPWAVTMVPIPQAGFAAIWLLMIPTLGDAVEIIIWNATTIMWLWSAVWDALLITEEAMRPSLNGDAYRYVGPKITALFAILEALVLLVCATATVFSSTFINYGPGNSSLYVLWLSFFIFVSALIPPLAMSIFIKIFSSSSPDGLGPLVNNAMKKM